MGLLCPFNMVNCFGPKVCPHTVYRIRKKFDRAHLPDEPSYLMSGIVVAVRNYNAMFRTYVSGCEWLKCHKKCFILLPLRYIDYGQHTNVLLLR